MSTIYERSEDTSTCFNKAALATLVTAGVFSFLPILQIIPGLLDPINSSRSLEVFHEDPPIVIEPIPEKPKEKPKLKKPEIEKPLPMPTLTEIEAIFLVGPGNIGFNYPPNYTKFIDTPGDIEIFNIEDLERKPRALFQIEPVYPYDLKNRRIEGWVLLEWVITDRGRVTSVRAIQYSHREFVQPSIDSISKSKWEPGEISSKAVNTRVRQKFTYNL